MNLRFEIARRLPWLNVASGVLILLLQRTPVLRVVAHLKDNVLAWRAGEVLRAAFTAAGLGAMHSRAGATTFRVQQGSAVVIQNGNDGLPTIEQPVTGTIGQPLISAVFTYLQTPASPARFQIFGSLPQGLAFNPPPIGSTVLSGTPAISGTPQTAGTFTIQVQGFAPTGETNNVQQPITIVISGSATAAPTITTHPQGRTVAAGAVVSFTVQATGSPAPNFQWTKNGASISGATSDQLNLTNVQAGDAGAYAVVVSNSAGSITSNSATLTVDTGGGVIAFASHPVSQTIASGGTVVFSAAAAGATNYRWQRNGTPIPGATTRTLVINNATNANAGSYTVIASGAAGSATSNAATLDFVTGADFSRLINLSILTDITIATPRFTLGTFVGGGGTTGNKPVLIRGAGPSLAQVQVPGPLPDPKLELFSNGTLSAQNDDWSGLSTLTIAFNQVGAFPYLGTNSKDAALFNANTAPGLYTVDVSGVGNATGTVLAELYDASANESVTAATPRLVNVSVLKQIESGTTLTAGFVIGGGVAARTVLIRAIGPALGLPPFGLPGAMTDPRLTLYRAPSTVLTTNDNWGGDPQLVDVGTSVGAFRLENPASRDAILLVTLAPGNYTAEVTGVSGGGSALVELYEVP